MEKLQELADAMVETPSVPPTTVADLRVRIRRRRRRSAALGAIALALVGALVFGTVWLRADDATTVRVAAGGTKTRPPATIPDLPAGIPQPSPSKTARAKVGRFARTVVYGDTLWAVTLKTKRGATSGARLTAFDAVSLRRRRSAPIPIRDRYVDVGLAASADSVWMLSQSFDGRPYVVTQVDTTSFRVRREIELPGPGAFGATEPAAIIATPGAAWIGLGTLLRIDEIDGVVTSRGLPYRPEGMAANRNSLWMFFLGANPQVMRFDLAGALSEGQNPANPTTFNVGDGFVGSIAVNDEAAYLTDDHVVPPGEVATRLVRIDADTHEISYSDMSTVQVVTGDGKVWVQLYDSTDGPLNRNGLVAQVDPTTGTILRTVRTPLRDPPFNGPTFAIANGSIWVGPVRVTP